MLLPKFIILISHISPSPCGALKIFGQKFCSFTLFCHVLFCHSTCMRKPAQCTWWIQRQTHLSWKPHKLQLKESGRLILSYFQFMLQMLSNKVYLFSFNGPQAHVKVFIKDVKPVIYTIIFNVQISGTWHEGPEFKEYDEYKLYSGSTSWWGGLVMEKRNGWMSNGKEGLYPIHSKKMEAAVESLLSR